MTAPEERASAYLEALRAERTAQRQLAAANGFGLPHTVQEWQGRRPDAERAVGAAQDGMQAAWEACPPERRAAVMDAAQDEARCESRLTQFAAKWPGQAPVLAHDPNRSPEVTARMTGTLEAAADRLGINAHTARPVRRVPAPGPAQQQEVGR